MHPNEMESGPALNRLVALRVLGWNLDDPVAYPHGCFCPGFSMNMEDAWRIVEVLLARAPCPGFFLEMTGKEWECSFMVSAYGYAEQPEPGDKDKVAVAATPALAIARAALMAVAEK